MWFVQVEPSMDGQWPLLYFAAVRRLSSSVAVTVGPAWRSPPNTATTAARVGRPWWACVRFRSHAVPTTYEVERNGHQYINGHQYDPAIVPETIGRRFVPEKTSAAIQSLIGAVSVLNIAVKAGTSIRTRRGAVRSLHRTLRKLVDADDLWAELAFGAIGTAETDTSPTEALLETVAELLSERQTALLVATGWQTPPPPPAHLVVEETRMALLNTPIGTRWGIAHVEEARSALRRFTDLLAKHLPTGRTYISDALLRRGRKVGISTALLLAVANVQCKTGDEFDVDFGVSLKDRFSVEVTVPKPWGGGDWVKSLLLQSAAINLIASSTDLVEGRVGSSPSQANAEPADEFSVEPESDAVPDLESSDWGGDGDQLSSDPPSDAENGIGSRPVDGLPPAAPLKGIWVTDIPEGEIWIPTDRQRPPRRPRA